MSFWSRVRKSREEKIDFLVDEIARAEETFPTAEAVAQLSPSQHSAFLETGEADERNSRWNDLNRQRDATIDDLFRVARESIQKKAESIFIPLNDAAITRLAKLDSWTVDETTAIVGGHVPHRDQLEWSEQYRHEAILAEQTIASRDLIERAAATGALPDPVPPRLFLRWWQPKNPAISPSLVEIERSLPREASPPSKQDRESTVRKVLPILWLVAKEKYGDQLLDQHSRGVRQLLAMLRTELPGVDRTSLRRWLRQGRTLAELRASEPDIGDEDESD